MAFYLPLVNYRNNWKRLGFSDADLAGGGSKPVPRRDGWHGEPKTAIRQRIQAQLDAGANHVCILPLHREGQPLPDCDAPTLLAA